jgi:Uncharacterized conserved protein
MEQPKIVHSTFTLERRFPKPPEVVFTAFSDPAKLRRWFADSKYNDIENFSADFRVGGQHFLSYRINVGPVAGMLIENKSHYHAIVPNERIVEAATMSIEGQCMTCSQVSFEFIPTKEGTELIVTHQGAFFENSGGPELREQGWRSLMDRLTEALAS